MTNEEMLTRELQHLVKLSATHPNWASYAIWKAEQYQRRWPALYAELPGLLANQESGLSKSSGSAEVRAAAGTDGWDLATRRRSPTPTGRGILGLCNE